MAARFSDPGSWSFGLRRAHPSFLRQAGTHPICSGLVASDAGAHAFSLVLSGEQGAHMALACKATLPSSLDVLQVRSELSGDDCLELRFLMYE